MPDFEQMVRRQQVLADFGEFALRSDDLDEVLTEACRLVGETMGTKRAKILEIQDGGRSLLMRSGVGWKPDIVGRVRLDMTERSSESFSIKAGEPVVTRDIREENRFDVPDFMKEAGVIALANVPIFLPGGKAYGLLQVDEHRAARLRPWRHGVPAHLCRYPRPRHRPPASSPQARQATEERFRLIVETARDYAIFTTDAEGRITDWFSRGGGCLRLDRGRSDRTGRQHPVHPGGPGEPRGRNRTRNGPRRGCRAQRALAPLQGRVAGVHRGQQQGAARGRRGAARVLLDRPGRHGAPEGRGATAGERGAAARAGGSTAAAGVAIGGRWRMDLGRPAVGRLHRPFGRAQPRPGLVGRAVPR